MVGGDFALQVYDRVKSESPTLFDKGRSLTMSISKNLTLSCAILTLSVAFGANHAMGSPDRETGQKTKASAAKSIAAAFKTNDKKKFKEYVAPSALRKHKDDFDDWYKKLRAYTQNRAPQLFPKGNRLILYNGLWYLTDVTHVHVDLLNKRNVARVVIAALKYENLEAFHACFSKAHPPKSVKELNDRFDAWKNTKRLSIDRIKSLKFKEVRKLFYLESERPTALNKLDTASSILKTFKANDKQKFKEYVAPSALRKHKKNFDDWYEELRAYTQNRAPQLFPKGIRFIKYQGLWYLTDVTHVHVDLLSKGNVAKVILLALKYKNLEAFHACFSKAHPPKSVKE
ncbi:MAG: hypothetical protein P1V97_28575, partial [Planctomycetota bacterium]|nr:hypothetical protein [Planctomycetota bacterium]